MVTTHKTQTFTQLVEADSGAAAQAIASAKHYEGRIDLKVDMKHTTQLASVNQAERYGSRIVKADS
jgi:glycine cleavage system regulatory protein